MAPHPPSSLPPRTDREGSSLVSPPTPATVPSHRPSVEVPTNGLTRPSRRASFPLLSSSPFSYRRWMDHGRQMLLILVSTGGAKSKVLPSWDKVEMIIILTGLCQHFLLHSS